MMRPSFLSAALAAALAVAPAIAAPPATVERSLEVAGANRPELEQVLDHYRAAGDPQKLAAAEFLIANMEGHGYTEHGFFTESGEEIPFEALVYANYGEALAALEALEKVHGSIDYKSRAFHPDLETITADYLIDNIDLAFAAWRSRPWAQGISFDAFCEYVLPYRGSNEPLNRWRAACMERLAGVTENLADPSSLDEAGAAVLGDARRWVRFSEQYYLHPTDQGFDEMLETRTGRCEDMTNMMSFACRANAVMVAADYTPWWATRDNNHAWEVRLDADGRGHARLSGRAAKVYRKTFSVQPDALGAVKDEDESVPRWLARKTYKDVTGEYMETTDVTVRLTGPPSTGSRYAYLCVFNGGEWRAIHWGRVADDGMVTFTGMGRGIAYLPAYYLDEKLVGAAPPLIVNRDGTVTTLEGNAAGSMVVSVTAKDAVGDATIRVAPGAAYELFVWDGEWRSHGKLTLTGDKRIAFAGVPRGRLYWLVAEGSRKLERIFTVEGGSARMW